MIRKRANGVASVSGVFLMFEGQIFRCDDQIVFFEQLKRVHDFKGAGSLLLDLLGEVQVVIL